MAILLVLIGSIFLGVNLGCIPPSCKDIFISWQMLLIVLGVSFFLQRHFFGGFILIGVGTLYILPVVGENFPELMNGTLANASNYWPVLLIIAGLLFLFSKEKQGKHCKYWQGTDINRGNKEMSSNKWEGSDYIEKSVLFTGSEEIIFSSNFRGGDINAAFGEIRLDLRKVTGLSKENNLELNVMFGSIIVYVPSEWKINLKSSALFGEVKGRNDFDNASITNDSPCFNLEANALFGSIEIRG